MDYFRRQQCSCRVVCRDYEYCGGEFCPSGLDVNLEFDPTKKCSAGKLAVRLCAVFRFCADFAFAAIRADLFGKVAVPECNAVAGCPRGPISLVSRPKRGTTWQKPVAKGRHLVIPYPRWQKNEF
jgi:hypothetical protein